MRIFLKFILVGVAGASLVGCASDKSVIAQAAESHKQLEPAIITDKDLAAYMQQVGDRVVKAAREDVQEGYQKDRVYAEDPSWMFDEVQFHLVNSKTLNAFTTGGQHVYLYSELFRSAKTEDEFAAVVAHEFSHIVARHVAKGMNRQYAIIGTAAAAGIGGYALGGDNRQELAMAVGGGALAAGQFIGLGFGRKDEAEADKFGFQFYCHAGWDPDQFPGFFQTMIDKGYDTTPELASDHPLLKNRVADAKKWAEKWKSDHPDWQQMRQPDIASAARFRQLQDRSVAVGKTTPNDSSLKAALLMFDSFPSCVAPKDQPRQSEARTELGELLQDQTKDRSAAKPKAKRKA